MRKIETAHTRARMHRKRFGQRDPRRFLRIEQTEERALFRMIGGRRVPRRGANPAVLFPEQLFLREFFVAPEAPGHTRFAVKKFSERLRESVRKRLGQD